MKKFVQLNIFDYYEAAKKKSVAVVKKIVSIVKKPEPELYIGINKHMEFYAAGTDVGIVKYELLKVAGMGDYTEINGISAYLYVRGEETLDDMKDMSITYGFTHDAEKELAKMSKEWRRRNIPLRVTLKEADL